MALYGMATAIAAESPTGRFDFLYIDANVGMSSGGHVALRIGDEVFHYQHDPEGFISLARDVWPRFRLIYNDLDNRNIYVARVKIDADDLERLHDRFVRVHLIQKRHVDFLAALSRDVDILQQWSNQQVPQVRGAALFRLSSEANPALRDLTAAIGERFGTGHLHQRTAELERRIAVHAYSVPDVDTIPVSDTRFPDYPPTYSETLLDTLAQLAALRALAGDAHPVEDAWLDGRRYGIADTHLRLTGGQRTRLNQLAHRLCDSILTLLASPRSDAGFPLLLATARYLAIRQSLVTDRLILIHPYFGSTANVSFPADPQARQALVRSSLQFAASFRETRDAFFRLAELDEASLNLLENSAARYFETQRALQRGTPFRLPAEFVMPTAPGAVPVERQRPSGHMKAAIETAQQARDSFRSRLRQVYPYNLVARNCATELVRTLNSAFRDEEEAAQSLGALVHPDAVSARIPFRLFDAIASGYRVEFATVLPSFRQRTVGRWARQQNPLWIYLAESNTTTSSLYRRQPGDTLFLLFTDDVFWARPLYGAANLGYGLLHAGAGVLSAPFDRGDRVVEGLRGVLFSLPELAFVNIRKGSFSGTDLR